MKLVSWNVNGLRAVVTKGFEKFFKEIEADVFCIQETKMQKEQAEMKQTQIKMQKELTEVKQTQTEMQEEQVGMKQIQNEILKRLDIISNVNMAQILNEQTKTRIEINKKLDDFIKINEVEHKKFEYEIAKLKM